MPIFQEMDWSNWLIGMWAAVIGGGSNAVVGGISLNLIDPNHFNMHTAEFYKLVGAMFATNATLSFFMYLKQSPLPKIVSRTVTTTIVETKETPKTPDPPVSGQ